MTHHLTRQHRVENKEEQALLFALTSGRFKGRLSCPVCGKTRLARLDRHLSRTHMVAGKDREQMLNEAKRECIIRGLAVPAGPLLPFPKFPEPATERLPRCYSPALPPILPFPTVPAPTLYPQPCLPSPFPS